MNSQHGSPWLAVRSGMQGDAMASRTMGRPTPADLGEHVWPVRHGSGTRIPRVPKSSRRVADQCTEAGQRSCAGPVVDPDAALVAVQQAAFVQHLEVMANSRLGQVEGA